MPDEVRKFEKGKVELVKVGGAMVGKNVKIHLNIEMVKS